MSKKRYSAKCHICEDGEAIWAMQNIADDELTFTTLGSHYRGFKVVKVCDECKDALQNPEDYLNRILP